MIKDMLAARFDPCCLFFGVLELEVTLPEIFAA